jgi:hypothetical protein
MPRTGVPLVVNVWSRTPPEAPGRYRCRFLPSLGIDRTPFVVELVENPLPGEPLVARRGGMCVSLREYAECEWGGRVRPEGPALR